MNPFIDYPELTFAILIALLAAALAFCLILFLKFRKHLARQKELFGSGKKDLQQIVEDIAKRSKRNENDVKELYGITDELKEIQMGAVQKVKMVRYNPFGDSGGDQSFTLVLLDDRDNGVLVTSLYSRESSRVFSKAIINGKSKHALTDEEKGALEELKIKN